MKAIIYFTVYAEYGLYDDSIIIEGSDLLDLMEKRDFELSKRGATYTGSQILEE